MNLVIDCGNTNIKLALFVQNKMIDYKSITSFSIDMISDFLAEHSSHTINSVCVSNNSKYDFGVLKNNLSLDVVWINISHESRLPIKIHYHTPETLGPDRIALATAASIKYSGDKLIVDFGTCITYDFVTGNDFLGGQINLGFNTRFKALSYYTNNLPYITASKIDDVGQSLSDSIMGVTTRESMLIGVRDSLISELTHVIDKYKSRYPSIKIIFTGGDMMFFKDMLQLNFESNQNFIDPYLLMEGLNYIIAFNEEK